MMRFRYINLLRLAFQLLRSNYALRYDYDPEQGRTQLTTFLYRVCLAMVYPFKKNLIELYRIRSKQYMLAACTPTQGQIERVLNKLYDYDTEIQIIGGSSAVTRSYLYTKNQPAVYLYTADNPSVYWGTWTNYSSLPVIRIPQSLKDDEVRYEQFIADLNKLIPFYLEYVIQPY